MNKSLQSSIDDLTIEAFVVGIGFEDSTPQKVEAKLAKINAQFAQLYYDMAMEVIGLDDLLALMSDAHGQAKLDYGNKIRAEQRKHLKQQTGL